MPTFSQSSQFQCLIDDRQQTPVFTLPYAAESDLPSKFEEMAAACRSNPALASDIGRIDYKQLNSIANNLTRTLLNAPLARGGRVALLMRHDAPLIAGMLSILKAGMVVVTLNPSDPPVRLREILEDAAVEAILADREHAGLAARIAATGQSVFLYEDHMDSGLTNNYKIIIDPGAPAFLLHTSGTTGRPKGVIQTHRNVLHNAFRLSHGMGIGSQDRVLLLGALSGGQGLSTTWCALLNGAMLCPFPVKEKGLTGLAGWMREVGVSIYISSASLFRHFMKTLGEADCLAGVRLVRLGSEPATRDDFHLWRRHFPVDGVLLNTLSSSETGNITQMHLTAADSLPEGNLPVGIAAAGIEVLLLDSDGRLVPPGAVGEIVVRSAHLSPGYWRNEALTAARFRDSITGGRPTRMFRTGDLGRLDPQGRLECLGRRDHQVKIRGYRVELSEIERALLRLEEVDGAIAGTRIRDDGANHLIAYVVPRAGCVLTSDFLRGALRRTLPDHMVPTTFLVLEAFPLNAHGKIDRAALSRIELPVEQAPDDAGDTPRFGMEAHLGQIWSEAFGGRPVGRHANFFELGGDSLTAMMIAAKMHDQLHIEIRLQLFVEHPTLSGMAGAITGMVQSNPTLAAGDIKPAPRDAPLPLSFIQERVWRESQTVYGSAGHTVVARHRLLGPLDPDILRDCMSYIAGRHEILRTTFPLVQGQPFQKIHPPEPVELPYLDFSHFSDPAHQASEFFKQHAGKVFDLEAGPLILFWLVRIGAEEYWLLRVNHHIISDGWSWQVYFSELGRLYEARKHGQPPPLPDYEPIQYADYAAWQRDWLSPDGHAYQALVHWWREKLAGSPPSLDLPFSRLMPIKDAAADNGVKRWSLAPDVTGRLEQLGRAENTTYFVVRLAMFVALLAAETRQTDVVIGTYVANRKRVVLQRMFGFFADLVTLRFAYNENLSLQAWLGEVGRVLAEAEAHAEIPYQTLCEDLRSHGVNPPEITALFTLSSHFNPVRFSDMALTWIKLHRWQGRIPWGFTLALDPHNDETPFGTWFNPCIHDPQEVDRFMRYYCRLLELGGLFPSYPMVRLMTMARYGGVHERRRDYSVRRYARILVRKARSLLGKI